MTMEFVTFEIAKKLKEKGFKDECFAYYLPNNSELCYNIIHYRGVIVTDCLNSFNSCIDGGDTSDYIDAPTIDQVLEWLRKEKSLYIRLSVYWIGWCFDITDMNPNDKFIYGSECEYQKFEQAALAGINYVLNNLI